MMMPSLPIFVWFRRYALLLALVPLVGCAMAPDSTVDESSPGAGMVRLAQQMQRKGDNMGALDFYMRALQRDARNLEAYRGSAAILEQAGDLTGAAAQYREALGVAPRDGDLHRSLGRVLIAQRQFADARDEYTTALDIDSDDAKSQNGLGIALDHLGDHVGAQKRFKAALRRDSKNLATINNLAYAYIQDGKYGEAIKLLEPEQKNPKATPSLRQNLALAYGLSGMELDAARVARMDLPPSQVKDNLDFYKRRRAELAVSTTPYAEIGSFATEAMAAAEIARLQPHLDRAGADLKPVIEPEVALPGGTPRFTVRMLGCAKPSEVKTFCDYMTGHGLPCTARGK